MDILKKKKNLYIVWRGESLDWHVCNTDKTVRYKPWSYRESQPQVKSSAITAISWAKMSNANCVSH